LLAEQLGRGFVDLDDLIEAAEGRSVPELWVEWGEAEFRRLELEQMERALEGPPSVIAPGGGWAAIPGAMGRARELAFIIYLRVKPTSAARRLGEGAASAAIGRPVLGEDPLRRLGELLAERERFYLEADLVIDNEGTAAEAVAAIRNSISL
jgi:shikimate kinase